VLSFLRRALSCYSACMTRLAIAIVTVFLLAGCNDGPMDGSEPAAFQTPSNAAYTQQQLEAAQEPDEPTFMLPDQ
jgi:hypothetical protein